MSVARLLYEKLDAGLPPMPPGDECRVWTRTTQGCGYGTLFHEGVILYAHRVLWEREHRVILTSKQHILHKCDNPPCVRLSHLFLGNAKLNSQDCALKGRINTPPWKKLSLEKAREIRAAVDVPLVELATQYDVHPFTIQRVLEGRIWREPIPGGLFAQGVRSL